MDSGVLEPPVLTQGGSFVILASLAEVAEQADAHDSKSCSLGSVGSIPTFGTQRWHYNMGPTPYEQGPLITSSNRKFSAWIYLPYLQTSPYYINSRKSLDQSAHAIHLTLLPKTGTIPRPPYLRFVLSLQ